MLKTSKIYVAGHLGLVGSAITKILKDKGYTNIIGRSSKELDQTDARASERFFCRRTTGICDSGCCQSGRNHGQQYLSRAIHLREPDDSEQRDPRSIPQQGQKAIVPGIDLYLSEGKPHNPCLKIVS